MMLLVLRMPICAVAVLGSLWIGNGLPNETDSDTASGLLNETHFETASSLPNETGLDIANILSNKTESDTTSSLPNGTDSDTNAPDLYKELFKKLFYEREYLQTPPNKNNPREGVNMSMAMTLDTLLHLDMIGQALHIAVWFKIQWQDKSLAWDTNVYPFKVLAVDQDLVWKPVIAIANSLLPRDLIVRSEFPLELLADGTMRWWPGDKLIVECSVDIRYYPYDVQKCNVRAMQWVGDVQDANCTQASMHLSVEGNGQWDIVDNATSITTDQASHENTAEAYIYWWVDFNITFRRKSTFYTMNFLFPVVLVSGLNCVVFLLPVECGEKMSVSVTTLLTLVVYMSQIQDELPNNSDHVCYLAIYLIAQMIFGALGVVLSALQLEFHHVEIMKGEREPEVRMWERPEQSLKFVYPTRRFDNDNVQSGVYQHFQRLQNDAKRKASRASVASQGRLGTRTRSVMRRCTHAVAELDVYCFPLFLVFNLVSFLTYWIAILRGPASQYL